MNKAYLRRKDEALRRGLDLLIRRDRGAARINAIPVHRNMSFDHWHVMCMLSWAIVQSGCKVVVEAVFEDAGRADIFIPELLVVIEVLHSETIDRFLEKTKEYHGLPVRIGWITTDEAKLMTVEESMNLAFSRAKRV